MGLGIITRRSEAPRKFKDKYKVLECLTSNGTEYFDIDVAVDLTTYKKLKFVLDMVILKPSATGWYLSGTGYADANCLYMGCNVTNVSQNPAIYYGDGLTDVSSSVKYDYTRRTWTMDVPNGKVSVSGLLDKSVTFSTPKIAQNFILFGYSSKNDGMKLHKGTLYPSQVYYDGLLFRDIVPVKDVDTGEVGLLDRVTNVFYPNKGTGACIAGSETGEVIKEYAS